MTYNQWQTCGDEIAVLLDPIFAFVGVMGWKAHDLPDDEVEKLQRAIAPCAQEIHAYWLARRFDQPPLNLLIRRSEAKVGRNEPCPCGSGKKIQELLPAMTRKQNDPASPLRISKEYRFLNSTRE